MWLHFALLVSDILLKNNQKTSSKSPNKVSKHESSAIWVYDDCTYLLYIFIYFWGSLNTELMQKLLAQFGAIYMWINVLNLLNNEG